LSNPVITAITTIKAMTPIAIPKIEITLIKEMNFSFLLVIR
jgi:hypothetical protein